MKRYFRIFIIIYKGKYDLLKVSSKRITRDLIYWRIQIVCLTKPNECKLEDYNELMDNVQQSYSKSLVEAHRKRKLKNIH